MPFKMPEQDHVHQFIVQTHQVEKIDCRLSDVIATANKTKKHFHAFGHLHAFTYLLSLVDKQDFPVRDPATLINRYRSEAALFWLKETHIKMAAPIIEDPRNELDGNGVKRGTLGVWRTVPADNTFSIAPSPHLIPAVLRNWLFSVGTLHAQARPNLDNPYGISKELHGRMRGAVNDTPLFFSVMQPFHNGNNRIGRLVANALRIAWRMPLDWNIANNYENFKADLEIYQTQKMPAIMQAARDLKFQ